LLERHVSAAKFLHRQFAALIQRDETGNIALRDATSHIAAANRLFIRYQRGVREGEGRGRRGRPALTIMPPRAAIA